MNVDILNTTFNFSGFIVGLFVFVTIMFARWLCIWGEYHFTKTFWIAFLVIGIIGLSVSLYSENLIFSSAMSAFGFIFLWGIHETIEQEERVKKGWFKKKENKKN